MTANLRGKCFSERKLTHTYARTRTRTQALQKPIHVYAQARSHIRLYHLVVSFGHCPAFSVCCTLSIVKAASGVGTVVNVYSCAVVQVCGCTLLFKV